MLKKDTVRWGLLFVLLLLGISFAYNYHSILFERPYSTHQWRQCDCLSITLNYYKEGMHFFTPVTHWCGPNGDGKVSTSECPIIYYTVACLWQIFGYHEFIYRLVVILISFAGLFYLYKLTYELLSDRLLAIMVSLFLFASPIFAFYANNFILDLPALSFAIIAWYFFVRFIKIQANKQLYISVLFFTLAGLTKLSALIAFAPILLLFPIEMLGLLKLNNGNKIFNSPLKQGMPFLAALVVIAAWTLYVVHYNSRVDIRVFSTQIFPIWHMNSAYKGRVFTSFYSDLLPQFYSLPALITILAMFATITVLWKKANSLLLFSAICIFSGVIAYIILWFQVLDVHDYYLINLLILVPFIIITFLHYLKNNHTRFFSSITLKILFGVFLAFNIYYTAIENRAKYPADDGSQVSSGFILRQKTVDMWNWFHGDYNLYLRPYETIEDYNRSLGIKREDKVISIPDNSVNISLYLMDQKGFTDYYYPTMPDLPRLKQYILLGAKYLFINDSDLLHKDWIKPYITHPFGAYRGISIYNLQTPDIIPEVIKDTKRYIRSDSNWISNIRTKALAKHISVDSMLTLDAIWTIKTAKK
ncbi:MAG TPA: glycosyltransferase family 39 protein [Bacteroidia bacterium]|nr:glycosyltransferase family 39 protein [Bacteroidia bacterium]